MNILVGVESPVFSIRHVPALTGVGVPSLYGTPLIVVVLLPALLAAPTCSFGSSLPGCESLLGIGDEVLSCVSGSDPMWTSFLFLQVSVKTSCIFPNRYMNSVEPMLTAIPLKKFLADPSVDQSIYCVSEFADSPATNIWSGTCSNMLFSAFFTSVSLFCDASLPLSVPVCRGIVAMAAATIDASNSGRRFTT